MSPSNIEDLFAFAFMAWSSEEGGEEVTARLGGSRDALTGISSFHAEVERLRFDVHGAWRVSQVSVTICRIWAPFCYSCQSDMHC
jgi:myotubularin-related protein 3/4